MPFMYYYVYKNEDKIIGYNISPTPIPPPAILLTNAEAVKYGLTVTNPSDGIGDGQNDKALAYSDIATAIREGINEI